MVMFYSSVSRSPRDKKKSNNCGFPVRGLLIYEENATLNFQFRIFWGQLRKIIRQLLGSEFNKEQFLFEKFSPKVDIFQNSRGKPNSLETFSSIRERAPLL